ncbi:PepSY-associated TM helix domain-containing protein [Asticcacaulis sp. AND118]|uniref:PepSY-associated TM helix domain-containing protein n=1 Tax=Asticcacaulis sp. AND118 TaxID=2840468 RepID=UPI001CFFF1BB|nr:PepSY-associated TM helix domain-containing protein [Asticcacaulis sp. AND118]UDF05110.1 PepSY-associated TM helix domain-containing protein [Asticcacaulis sp. AND118]
MPIAFKPSPSFWRNQLRQWHWISSALCLVGMILFSVTGFTLNHASLIEAKPEITTWEKDLSEATIALLPKAEDKKLLPVDVAGALKAETGVDVSKIVPEVSETELYFAMPGPGFDEWMSVERDTGYVSYEKSHRGVIAVLNDLHKGRNAGPAWSLFIDIIAIASVIFCLTGLGLLWIYARGRRITWPLIGLGAIVPFILFLLFIHA